MANFIIAIDGEKERREKFIIKIKPELPPVEELTTNWCSCGDFCAIWSCEKKAPVSDICGQTHASVLWGEAISESGRVDAERLRQLWKDPRECERSVFDGFYAAAVYEKQSGLVVGADVLGIYPVYYWTGTGVLLAGSSPELFRHHPLFKAEFNPAGLAGILLTMHIFDGQTLLKGVRRLSAGHLLWWREGKEAVELPQYKIGVSKNYFNLPFSAHVEILNKAINESIGKHTRSDEDYTLMLSGGLDSRMLAGYLDERCINTSALTFGRNTDFEMQCAESVVRELRMHHSKVDIDFKDYAQCAGLCAKWEHLSSGFNDISEWRIEQHLRQLGTKVILGHMVDAVMGTRYINWAYSRETQSMSFESYFQNLNRWAIKPEILRKLLKKDVFGDAVDETLEKIKKVYQNYSDLESQRAWCFNLYHRQRFHVGRSAWVASFGAWPVVPALDRQLLEAAGGMPASTIAERRAQVELVCQRFPRLAALPLDRNNFNLEPLKPRARYLIKREISNRLRPFSRLVKFSKNGQGEKLYYPRIYDFNSSGWTAIRERAEPFRERLFGIFDREELRKFLPGPAVQVDFDNRIIDASGLKLLVGLMLWSRENL